MRSYFSQFSLRYAATIIYMLQSSEYRIKPYLNWYWRTKDFRRVSQRGQLDKTKAAKTLLLTLKAGIAITIGISFVLLANGVWAQNFRFVFIGLILLAAYPTLWAHLIIAPTILAKVLIILPNRHRQNSQTEKILSSHSATIIAVAGSYGKTSVKELLRTVLSEGKKVAATPANKNVLSEHAVFARGLSGDEDILIIEFGEARPGDIAKFAKVIQPDMAVITGVAPAHLDQYPNLASIGRDIFSIAHFVSEDHIYVNSDSEATKDYLKPGFGLFNSNGALGWKANKVKVSLEGLEFQLANKSENLQIKSGLVGRHQIGPLSLAAALAVQLGLSKKQIEAGISKTTPFEHRMQPRQLGGAWLIDDTYNGNIEGVGAGLAFLQEIPAKRKIYVTPGLVDQGEEMVRVHQKIGEMIAKHKPDQTVLMQNSVSSYILEGLKKGGYKGEIIIEDKPLEFYQGIEHILAAGDVALLQNDWPDLYA